MPDQQGRVGIGQVAVLARRLLQQCAAVAIDKKAGTPGFGWSIGIDKATAQREALAHCIATAGKSREKFCEQSVFFCDGTAAK
jgi:alpha-D-ribose 1-methylphosphonate 5-triphosphate synthase subunit PhnG